MVYVFCGADLFILRIVSVIMIHMFEECRLFYNIQDFPSLWRTNKVDLKMSWTDDVWMVNENRIMRLNSSAMTAINCPLKMVTDLLEGRQAEKQTDRKTFLYGKNVRNFCTSAFMCYFSMPFSLHVVRLFLFFISALLTWPGLLSHRFGLRTKHWGCTVKSVVG